MKSITTLILVFFAATVFAQPRLSINPVGNFAISQPFKLNTQPKTPEVLFTDKSDTLIVPVDKYKFIKVGDKVYKITSSLEEVEERGFHGLLQSGIDTIHAWSNPIYLPNNTFQLPIPNYYN